MKFGDTINLKNGDAIFGYKDVYDLKIASIIDNYIPYEISHTSNSDKEFKINILLSKELFEKELSKIGDYRGEDAHVSIYISTEKPFEIDEKIDEIRKISYLETSFEAQGFNLYKTKLSEESKKNILSITLYLFIGFITCFSIINIFNTIFSSLMLRKGDFAILKSLGMSNKQIKKMLFLEGIFYGFDSILYGIIISTLILYIMYLKMIDTNLYIFTIPWNYIFTCILVTYAVIFISMWIARKKINKQNIIDEIKIENI